MTVHPNPPSKYVSIRSQLSALFLIALALAARLIPAPRTIDDAYITFRYARSILARHPAPVVLVGRLVVGLVQNTLQVRY